MTQEARPDGSAAPESHSGSSRGLAWAAAAVACAYALGSLLARRPPPAASPLAVALPGALAAAVFAVCAYLLGHKRASPGLLAILCPLAPFLVLLCGAALSAFTAARDAYAVALFVFVAFAPFRFRASLVLLALAQAAYVLFACAAPRGLDLTTLVWHSAGFLVAAYAAYRVDAGRAQASAQGRAQGERRSAEHALTDMGDHVNELLLTDPQTGLSGRETFERLLFIEWSHCARQRAPLTLAYLAMEDFDSLMLRRDSQAVLRATAQAVKCVLRRSTDCAVRGEKGTIVLLLPYTEAEGGAFVACQALQQVADLSFSAGPPPVMRCGLSTLYPGRGGVSMPAFVQEAQEALRVAGVSRAASPVVHRRPGASALQDAPTDPSF